jgi:dipeptidyl aminopeptidase/acylaminoacyl peptidase
MKTKFLQVLTKSPERRMRFVFLLFLLLSVQLILSGSDYYRFRPKFTLEQITQTRVIHEFAISPDGKKVAYSFGGYDIQRFGEGNNIWVVSVETGEIRKLTSGLYPKTNPGFSPSGDRITFEADGDIWIVEVATGEVKRMTVSPASDRGATWSPDGKQIAFVSNRSDRYGERGGMTDIWIKSVEKLQEKGKRIGLVRLTNNRERERELQWSPDGKTIVFSVPISYNPKNPGTAYRYASGIFSVPSTGGPVTRLTPPGTFDNYCPRWSPDSRKIAFLSYLSGYLHVWTMNPDGTQKRESDTGPFDTPWRAGSVNPSWSRNGLKILVSVNRGGRFDLDIIDVATAKSKIVCRAADSGSGQYHEIGWGPNEELVYAYENAWSPPDLYVKAIDAKKARQLTFSSHAAFRKEHFANVKPVLFKSFDGLMLDGFLLTPTNLKSSDRLPAVMYIHGGTYGQNCDEWMPFYHYIVQSGYIMLLANQRGSAGRGRAFREALIGAYDTEFLEDLKAMATFLKSQPFVDPDAIGVMGKSHGGYRAMFLMTRAPGMVAAGISLMGHNDRRSPYLNAGGRSNIIVSEEEDPEIYERLSPIVLVDKLQGPVFIIHTDRDRNVPPAISYNLVEELKRLKKEYEAVFYPDEAHGTADPAHRLDCYKRIMSFLDRHLKNRKNK